MVVRGDGQRFRGVLLADDVLIELFEDAAGCDVQEAIELAFFLHRAPAAIVAAEVQRFRGAPVQSGTVFLCTSVPLNLCTSEPLSKTFARFPADDDVLHMSGASLRA